MIDNSAAHKMLTLVKKIPRGRVATYGQIATLAGHPRNARQVGSILKSQPEGTSVPWHRVVNAQGRVSARSNSVTEGLQRFLLTSESVELSDAGGIDLKKYQWRPRPYSLSASEIPTPTS